MQTRIVPLNEIRIQRSFDENAVSKAKLAAAQRFYDMNKRLDRNITVNKRGILTDGFVAYLTAKRNGLYIVPVLVDKTEVNNRDQKKNYVEPKDHVYVYGTHVNGYNHNEYVWRVNKKTRHQDKLAVGQFAMVMAHGGFCPIEITKIETLKGNPFHREVKPVVAWLEGIKDKV